MSAYDLDNVLMSFGSGASLTEWTARHAVEGVQIFGGIGSGKTSGSGRMLALKYLEAGFGGLVLTVKPDEKQLWQDYCHETGRANDLIVLEPGSGYHFNFLDYVSQPSNDGTTITENIVEVLKTVIRAGDEKDKGTDSSFWEQALDMVMFNVVDLCLLAYGTLSVSTLYEIMLTLPQPVEYGSEPNKDDSGKAFNVAYSLAQETINIKLNQWREGKKRQGIAFKSQAEFDEKLSEELPEALLFQYVSEFFYGTFKNLNSKTRSIVEFMLSGFLYRFLREPLSALFCKNQTNVIPEDCHAGKIILINLPLKKYHKVGRDAQILFKYIWQRSMEKRHVSDSTVPVFLWADEAQNFLHEHDSIYQATARSSRIATVVISQNLPNYFASMGGDKPEHRVKGFLGTLGTKIFHANADLDTNKYASDIIGEEDYIEPSSSFTVGAENFSQGSSETLRLMKAVRPEKFVSLKTGGPLNGGRVQAYIHKQGDPLFGELNYRLVSFKQKNN